jgi:hypothetical protein
MSTRGEGSIPELCARYIVFGEAKRAIPDGENVKKYGDVYNAYPRYGFQCMGSQPPPPKVVVDFGPMGSTSSGRDPKDLTILGHSRPPKLVFVFSKGTWPNFSKALTGGSLKELVIGLLS